MTKKALRLLNSNSASPVWLVSSSFCLPFVRPIGFRCHDGGRNFTDHRLAHDNSTFSYVIATATQANSLNQDLNGVGGNYDGNATWSTLGVITDPLTAGGVPVPEPGTAVASALIAAAAIVQSQVRRKARRL